MMALTWLLVRVGDGRPEISSCSLPKAIMLPVKEIEPMMMPSTMETISPRPMSSLCRNSTRETSAAVAPPMPLKMATICGMAVILTRRAAKAESAAPMARPTRISKILCRPGMNSVATMATAMPTRGDLVAAARGGRRAEQLQAEDEADRGDEVGDVDEHDAVVENPVHYLPPAPALFPAAGFRLNISSMRSVTTKPPKTLAAPRTTAMKAEQLQHVVEERDASMLPRMIIAPEHDDAVDGVRARHQRRVQRGRHPPDQLDAEKDRQEEHVDREQDHRRVVAECGLERVRRRLHEHETGSQG